MLTGWDQSKPSCDREKKMSAYPSRKSFQTAYTNPPKGPAEISAPRLRFVCTRKA
ncbi:hypothetical protein D3C71_2224790 [compost metagenome]